MIEEGAVEHAAAVDDIVRWSYGYLFDAGEVVVALIMSNYY